MSASSSTLAQLKPFTLGSRSIFIKCVPAPRSFYERRAVLAVLQRSSRQSIETFKKLEDSSSFIAITTKPDVAATLVNDSPIQRAIVSQASNRDTSLALSTFSSTYDDVRGPIATPINPLPVDVAAKPTPASADLGLSYTTFTLHIFPANEDYNHSEQIKKNPLHGQWPGNCKTESYISAALQKVIPSGPLAPALRDWDTGNQLAPDSFGDHGLEGAASMLLGKKRRLAQQIFTLERIRRRSAEQETPKVMGGLFQFVEESRAEAAKAQSEPSQDIASTSTDSQTQTSKPSPAPSSARKTDTLLDDSAFKSLMQD